MNKINILLINDFDKYINTYGFYRKIFNKIKSNINVDIIDISQKKSSYYKKKILLNKFKLIKIKKTEELDILLKKKKYLYLNIGNINEIKYIKINHILIKNKVKSFSISDLGYYPNNFNFINRSLFEKIKIFITFRLNYYLYRFLCILHLYPKIDIHFEASSNIIKSIKNSVSYKIKNIFGINFSYYNKVIKINSRFAERKKLENKYIVFLDASPFHHDDVIKREDSNFINNLDLYHDKIIELLKILKKKFKCNVIICFHPKGNIKFLYNKFSEFKCFVNKSEYFISKAKLVVLHETSLIVQAVAFKKKILSIGGSILGNYMNNRIKMYKNILNLTYINLNRVDQNTKLPNIRLDIEKYKSFTKKNIISVSNSNSHEIILKELRSL
jgi:hypothetical protein